MEIRQLRYFLSTVRLGTVGAAAAEHFVTQPAVSLQIRKLEGELGQKLFVRRGRRIVPTDAGQALVARAEDVIRSLDSLEAELHGLKQLERGFEALGLEFVPSSGNFVLVRVGRADLVNEALLRAGIIVRPVGNYDLPEWLRVTVGLPEENDAFLAALPAALDEAAAAVSTSAAAGGTGRAAA